MTIISQIVDVGDWTATAECVQVVPGAKWTLKILGATKDGIRFPTWTDADNSYNTADDAYDAARKWLKNRN